MKTTTYLGRPANQVDSVTELNVMTQLADREVRLSVENEEHVFYSLSMSLAETDRVIKVLRAAREKFPQGDAEPLSISLNFQKQPDE